MKAVTIMLNCPHCRLNSRYDTSFLEDAIHDRKIISCVACGGDFQIFVVGMIHHTDDRVELAGEKGRDIPTDSTPYEVNQ